MVGGLTRMLHVQQRSPPLDKLRWNNLNPDEKWLHSVPPYRQNVLAGNKTDGEWLLPGVTPLSLRPGNPGGLAEKIIPRKLRSFLPRARRTSPTFKDGQTAMTICRGASANLFPTAAARPNLPAARHSPVAVAGAARIRVTFKLMPTVSLSVFRTRTKHRRTLAQSKSNLPTAWTDSTITRKCSKTA